MLTKRPIFTNSSNNCGFTLMELMVVITIVGILASMAIRSVMISRANVLNAAAHADTRTLGTVVVNAFVEGTDVSLMHNPGDGPRIGTKDTSGGDRRPIFVLSNGLHAQIWGSSNWFGTGLGKCIAIVWYPGHTKTYTLIIDEEFDLFSFPPS